MGRGHTTVHSCPYTHVYEHSQTRNHTNTHKLLTHLLTNTHTYTHMHTLTHMNTPLTFTQTHIHSHHTHTHSPVDILHVNSAVVNGCMWLHVLCPPDDRNATKSPRPSSSVFAYCKTGVVRACYQRHICVSCWTVTLTSHPKT